MTGLGLTLTAVLGASLVGSLHCVGMCGGFVASVSGSCPRGPGQSQGRRALGPLLAYQGARGLAYTILGALAGLLGAGLDASATIVGIQRVAGPLMGVVLIAMAVSTLRGQSREDSPLVGLATGPRRRSLLKRLRLHLASAVRERGASAGAAAGLLTALLPCGWLWAYLAVAASTGSVVGGSLVMVAFWLGSVPALVGVGLLAGELGRRLGRHAPRITAVLLLGLGILSLAGKLTITPVTHEHAASETTATEPSSAEQPTEHGPVELPHDAPCH